MYETFFGLREKPFSLLPDPRFLYASRTHRLGLTLLRYGLAEQTGFVVLTGEVGTGKTTLLRHLLAGAGPDTLLALVSNAHPGMGDLMRWVLLACGLDHQAGDAPALHAAFHTWLTARHAEGRRVTLVVDEAQNLDAAALEQLACSATSTSAATICSSWSWPASPSCAPCCSGRSCASWSSASPSTTIWSR